MNGNRIIVHTLIKVNNKFLLTKRSSCETTYPEYWVFLEDWQIMENYQGKH